MSLINSFPSGGKAMAEEDMEEIVTPLPSSYPRRMKYSTSEQVVGEWINGKPIYQKTFDLGSLQTISSTTWFNTGCAFGEADLVINAWGQSGGGSTSTTNACCPLLAYAESTSPNFAIMVARDNSSLGLRYFTVQYTKTTD